MDQLISLLLANGNVVGFTTLAFIVVMAFMRGWIVPRTTLQDVTADRDTWKKMALELKDDNSRLIVVGEMSARSMKALEDLASAKTGGNGS